MIQLFDIANVSRSAANFDQAKLLWVNQQHIAETDTGELAQFLHAELLRRSIDPAAGPELDAVVAALRDRARTIVEMADKAQCYFADVVEFDAKSAKAHLRPVAQQLLTDLRKTLQGIDVWNVESTQLAVEATAEQHDVKLGKLAQPLRVALTGQAASPGIGVTLALVGRERTLTRIDSAIAYIEERVANV